MTTRRNFLTNGGRLIAALTLPMALSVPASAQASSGATPVEDLMQEHGVLNRLLLIYEHTADEITRGKKPNLVALVQTRDLLTEFIHGCHEYLEEEYIFPLFQKGNVHANLVMTLLEQHGIGRQLTAQIGSAILQAKHDELALCLRSFSRMSHAHESREDTILFPAFRSMLGANEYGELAIQFKERETKLFGKEHFEKIIGKTIEIEKDLGIYDLSAFNPPSGSKAS